MEKLVEEFVYSICKAFITYYLQETSFELLNYKIRDYFNEENGEKCYEIEVEYYTRNGQIYSEYSKIFNEFEFLALFHNSLKS